jgi:hypothetical protein
MQGRRWRQRRGRGSEEEEEEEEESTPCHFGVPARVLDRLLHELRIAELERVQRKLREKEAEVSWCHATPPSSPLATRTSHG